MTVETTFGFFFGRRGKMSENFFSGTVYEEANKISALSGMMMATGTGDIVELDNEEVSAIGSMLCGICDKLREWNHREGDLDQSLLDTRDAQSFVSELLRRAKGHRKVDEIQNLLLGAMKQMQQVKEVE
jgi:hypothetical protein